MTLYVDADLRVSFLTDTASSSLVVVILGLLRDSDLCCMLRECCFAVSVVARFKRVQAELRENYICCVYCGHTSARMAFETKCGAGDEWQYQ